MTVKTYSTIQYCYRQSVTITTVVAFSSSSPLYTALEERQEKTAAVIIALHVLQTLLPSQLAKRARVGRGDQVESVTTIGVDKIDL